MPCDLAYERLVSGKDGRFGFDEGGEAGGGGCVEMAFWIGWRS